MGSLVVFAFVLIIRVIVLRFAEKKACAFGNCFPS
jgi:hypothetical protein